MRPLFFSILFFTFYTVSAQNNKLISVEILKRDTGRQFFQLVDKEHFEYDEYNNEISRVRDYWDIDKLKFKNSWRIEKMYSNDGERLLKEDRIVRSRSNRDDNLTQITYEYHQDNCLKKLERIWTQGEIKISKFIHHYNAVDCKIDSIILYNHRKKEWEKSERLDYKHKERQTVIYYSAMRGGKWEEFGKSRKSFDENENLIKSWTNVSDYASEEQRVYEYDQYNNKTKSEYWLKQGQSEELRLVNEDILENFYNEEEQLVRIEKKSTTYDSYTGEILFDPSSYTEHFTYFCDGLMKTRRSNSSNSTTTWETRYFYQTGGECLDKLDSPNVTIFPNPANSQIQVQSEALFSSDCIVSLFSAIGQLIYEQAIEQRVNQHQIFIENLDAGIYFLSIRYGDKVVTEKVVKY